MSPVDFERARSPEAKQARVAAILRAATELGTERTVRVVTLTDIAARAGLHKSALLRYFESREDIFLQLVAEQWENWASETSSLLRELSGNSPRGNVSQVVPVLVDSFLSRPLFCDLLGQTPMNLEHGVSFDAVKSFKPRAIEAVNTVAEALQKAVPLSPADALSTVAVATSLTGSLWQMAAPGTALGEFYLTEPSMAHAKVDLAPRLRDVLGALVRGYLRPSE